MHVAKLKSGLKLGQKVFLVLHGQKREGIGEGVDGLMDPYKLLIHYFSAVSSLI